MKNGLKGWKMILAEQPYSNRILRDHVGRFQATKIVVLDHSDVGGRQVELRGAAASLAKTSETSEFSIFLAISKSGDRKAGSQTPHSNWGTPTPNSSDYLWRYSDISKINLTLDEDIDSNMRSAL